MTLVDAHGGKQLTPEGQAAVCHAKHLVLTFGFVHSVAATEAGGSAMHLIGAAATMSGVHVETIRYYERAGIVPRAARTVSGRRRYTEEDIARLRFVRRCRDLGFSIPDIRTLLGLAEDSEPPLASTKILGERHLERIRRKIDELRELEHAITELIEHRDVARAPFPLLDRLFTEGASPARK